MKHGGKRKNCGRKKIIKISKPKFISLKQKSYRDYLQEAINRKDDPIYELYYKLNKKII